MYDNKLKRVKYVHNTITITSQDTHVICDSEGAYTITLPPVAKAIGQFYTFRLFPYLASGVVTLDGSGAEEILTDSGNQTTTSLASAARVFHVLYCDGEYWYVCHGWGWAQL